jgi:Tfp pilus assembly protein PilF
VDARYNLGLMYNQQHRFNEAKDMLEKVVSLDPEDTGAHFELGKSYKATGNLKGAKQEFGLALKKINRWRIEERAIIEKELTGLER